MLDSWLADPAPASARPASSGSSRSTPPSVGERKFVITVLLPIALSVLFHLGLLLAATFIYWTVQNASTENDEYIVPIARLSETPGAALTLRQSTPDAPPELASTARRTVTPPALSSTNSLAGRVNTSTSLAGVGEAGSSGWGGGPPSGSASGSRGNPFGTVVPAGGQFKATFYGTGGNARTLIYLVDASGSLIDVLPFVMTELKRSINELSDKQRFTIIFFQGNEAIEVSPVGLKSATVENKQKVALWLDASPVTPSGLANPASALARSLQYKPDLLFLLADNIIGSGRTENDQRRLLEEIDRANVHHTKINTIQFLYKDKLESDRGKSTLELIAERTGGVYKFMSETELGVR